MSGPRRGQVLLLNLLVLGGTALSFFSGKEYWPFCSYPVYCEVHVRWQVTLPRLYALPLDPRAPAEPLRHFDPFRPTRLIWMLNSLAMRDPGALPEALRFILQVYEHQRETAEPERPPIRGLALYRCHWRIEPWAVNAQSPDTQDLLYKYEP